MQQSLISSVQKRSAIGVIAIALLFSMVSGVNQAHAQSQADLQIQISQLMQILVSLQAQLNTMTGSPILLEGGFVDRNLEVGSKVKTTDLLRVRNNPGTQALWVNNVAANTVGTVVSGPRVANGYTWWLVNYENGTQGWSAQNWLNKMSSLATEVSVPKVTVSSVSNSENPTVRGYAYNTNTVGFSVDAGDKVYGSGNINVENNMWSHKISTDLEDGEYRLSVYVNNIKLTQTTFEVRSNEESVTNYDIDVTSPRRGSTFELGETITLRWNQENLRGQKGIVTLAGGPNNVQRHIGQMVNLSDGFVRVQIPANDRLLVAGNYKLKFWVSYIKEGDPKGVHDSVDIQIQSAPITTGSLGWGEYNRALGVGAYEGTYPENVRHSSNYHPQGEITVELPAGGSFDKGKYVLVLTAYEPVKWNIIGEGRDLIGRVLATGYHQQEVVGLSSSVQIDQLSVTSGDSKSFWVYNRESSDFEKLHEYIVNEYQVQFSQFIDGYSLDAVKFPGYKG